LNSQLRRASRISSFLTAEVAESAEERQIELDEITGQIVDASIKVHSALGPGMLESAYEACLLHELRKRAFEVQSQLPLPITYDGVILESGYKIDLLVERKAIVELKSVEKLHSLHEAQLLSYLKLSKLTVGLLINFNVLRLADGLKRLVNNFEG
jgi:GxxExxY protein